MNDSAVHPRAALLRCFLVAILAIAFGYIEAAVVVYLRAIFHPNGFTFPIESFPLSTEFRNFAMVEVGREAATLVLIFSACLLAGQNSRQRIAYFMIIFAVWDIFYYVWLKVLIGWPVSIMDWDILFLIPLPWASPVLAPIIVSLVMLIFAVIILYCDYHGKLIKISPAERLSLCLAGIIIVVSFCIAGHYITQAEYASHFSWLLFLAGLVLAITIFAKRLLKKNSRP
jgi:hypothetical protein